MLDGLPDAPEHAWLALRRGVFALLHDQDPEQAVELASETVRIGQALHASDWELAKWGYHPLSGVCRTQYAAVCLWRGAWEEAEQRFDRTLDDVLGVQGDIAEIARSVRMVHETGLGTSAETNYLSHVISWATERRETSDHVKRAPCFAFQLRGDFSPREG